METRQPPKTCRKLKDFQPLSTHLIRNSLDFVSYNDRKVVAAALKQIYRAKDAAAGEEELNAFAEGP